MNMQLALPDRHHKADMCFAVASKEDRTNVSTPVLNIRATTLALREFFPENPVD
jgi:hypothetical protein